MNLHGRAVFPAADILSSRHIPFVFLTGYCSQSLPAAYRSKPCLEKPFTGGQFAAMLHSVFGCAVV